MPSQNVNTLTILVMGKGGVGKSSTVNSIIGERAVTVNAFQVFVAVNTWLLVCLIYFNFYYESYFEDEINSVVAAVLVIFILILK